jgi:hypothetical protein
MLPGAKKNYVGAWRSAGGSALDIDSAGNMTFDKSEGSVKKRLSAPIAEFRGDDMVIKIGLPIVIHMTEPPRSAAGHWAMTRLPTPYRRSCSDTIWPDCGGMTRTCPAIWRRASR